MDKKDFIREFEERKEKYFEIENGYKNTESISKGMYLHEARNSIFAISEALEIGMSIEDIIEMGGREGLEKLKKLEPISMFKDFSRKNIKSEFETDLYPLIKKDLDYYSKKEGLEFELTKEDAKLMMNPSIAYNLFSTHIGDSVKWSPKNEPIQINLNQNSQNIYFQITNKAERFPQRKDIGLGEGLGNKYTNQILHSWGGEIKSKKENGNPYNTFSKKIKLPRY